MVFQFLKRGAAVAVTEQKASAAGPLLALQGAGRVVWSPRDTSSLTRSGYTGNPVGFRCVKMLAEAAAALPLVLQAEGRRFETHPVLALLGNPNPSQGRAELLEALYAQLLLTGNGYLELVTTDNTPWAHSRRRYDAGLGLRSLDDMERLIAFFEARRGQMFAFRWKDWADFRSCLPSGKPGAGDQVIGRGDGVTRVFQLAKSYRSGDQSYTRPIVKPVLGSVVLAIEATRLYEGVDFEVDLTTGLVTLAEAPTIGLELTAGFEFDVPVRFDTDRIATSVASFQAGEVPRVPVLEVRI